MIGSPRGTRPPASSGLSVPRARRRRRGGPPWGVRAATLTLLASLAPVPAVPHLYAQIGSLPSGSPALVRPPGNERIPARPVTPPAPFLAAVERGTRTADGRPGPSYWQQRADYRIEAALDPGTRRVTGSEVITYRNGSPDALTSLLLHLDQNVFAPGARRNRRAPVVGGMVDLRVRIDGREVTTRHPGSGYYQALTLLTVPLPRALPPGGSVELAVEWAFQVPPAPTFRNGNLEDEVFAVAQWYPRVAVYDDVYGWNAQPYLGDGEFYLEYGDFDVRLTLPRGWLVGATGTLHNAGDVLPPEIVRRLSGAGEAERTVRIADPGEMAAWSRGAPGPATVTWHFTADDVRDFAFSASPAYAWDAVAAGPGVVAHALYRPRFTPYRRAADLAAFTIRGMSRLVGPYRYPQVTITEGPVGGMEYPMLVLNPGTMSEGALAGVTVHETAHMWFPMAVGSMEAKHAWMDEGFTTFFEERLLAELAGAPPPRFGETASYLGVAGTEQEVPLMRHTDLVSPFGARTLAAYTKPAVVLGALRATLGEAVFDGAFRDYYASWTLRHPQPWDFFQTMERHAGRDLDWIWRPLFFETDVLDHAIESVRTGPDGTTIRIRDRGDVVLPTPVRIRLRDGTVLGRGIGAEEWLAGGRTVELTVPGEAVEVVLDPAGAFPDVRRENNRWAAAPQP